MRISPLSGSSRAISNRSSVLFPDPEGPMITTFSEG